MKFLFPILALFLFCKLCLAEEDFRTWTSSDGRTLEARFVEKVGSISVKIENATGKEFTLPKSSISAADWKYVEKLVAERKAKESSKPNVPTVLPYSELDQLFTRIAIDLDNKETLKIIAEATDKKNLEKRGEKGKELYYSSKEQAPYTGWGKEVHDNGRIKSLIQVKEGKMSGLINAWYENGQRKAEGKWKDGKMDGLLKGWYKNGQKKAEGKWKDGKFMSAEAWKPNGEKCPATNLKDGNGVVVMYEEGGTGEYRFTYKDGERVKD